MTASGVSVINSFLEGKTEGIYKYNSLCALLLTFEKWSTKSKKDFLTEFYDVHRLLGYDCSKLVECLCKVKWSLMPDSPSRKKFVDFLTLIAIHNVFHVKNVFGSMFEMLRPDPTLNLLPKSSESDDLMEIESLKEREAKIAIQNEIYGLAIDGITRILRSHGSHQRLFLEAAESNFPHIKFQETVFLGYLKNLIVIADRCSSAAQELWLIVISKMLQIDAMISKSTRQTYGKFTAGNSSLFAIEDDERMADTLSKQSEIELTQKLDKAVMIVLARISVGRKDVTNECNSEETKWVESIDFESDSDTLYEHLWPAFMELTLPAYDIQSVSFIWLYFCSFEEKYFNATLRILWNLVSLPSLAPNEWRRSQNAATFIGSFLARASYVDFSKAFRWMGKMADWCNEYINAAGLRKTVEGCLQHGTFYAVVQALLFVFTYRYREFVENNRVQDVHSWGLQRIIHSQFQPLRFISRVIALGFATISRQLQIVYCSHILEETSERSPIEHYLPFSIFQLPVSSSLVVPLVRKFQPAEEDADQISIDFADDPKKHDVSGDDDYDFMDDDEDAVMTTSPSHSLTAVLSSSPYSAFASTVTKANYITHH